MKENNYTVYVHVNKINEKKYVGITKQKPTIRWGKTGNRYVNNPYFTYAINKYGWNGFRHIILEVNLTREEACLKEQQYIEIYNSNNRKFGYNATKGGEGNLGLKLTDETKQKISKAKKKYFETHDAHNKGIPLDKEHLKKLQEGNKIWRSENPDYFKGRKISDEARKNLSIAQKKYFETHEGTFKGKHHTPDTKEKMQQIKKKQGISKSVICIETGEYFISLKDAQRKTGCRSNCISACCQGSTRYSTVGGYHWKFAD